MDDIALTTNYAGSAPGEEDEGPRTSVPSALAEAAGVIDRLGLDPQTVERQHHELTSIMLGYQFAIDQVLTRLTVLQEDFNHAHGDNPIEAITSRVKAPASVVSKARRKGVPLTGESIQKHIQDIAGVRVTCAFVEDVYTVKHLLLSLPDVTLVEERDYIAHPKENGYKSLHLIVSVPVVRASGTTDVTVEIQIRTIAMDFWASLEHKIYYKYNGNVPAGITESLREAAIVANLLDHRMQDLRHEVHSFNSP